VIKATWGERLDRLVQRVCPFLFRRPLNPNLLSVLGVLVSLCSAVSFARGALPLGGVLLFVGGFFDLVDGAVARHHGTSSSFGAFLDSTLDRIVDMAVLLGILMHYAKTGDLSLALLAGLASIFTVMVSYTKARAESIVSDFNGGIMERGERILLLIAGALTGYLPLCLGIVAAGSAVTAIQRMALAYREMAQIDAAAQGEKT
jgi:CDP-diacylglycerol--glycerol-3-phosphate 3-phosphatidyltransferase